MPTHSSSSEKRTTSTASASALQSRLDALAQPENRDRGLVPGWTMPTALPGAEPPVVIVTITTPADVSFAAATSSALPRPVSRAPALPSWSIFLLIGLGAAALLAIISIACYCTWWRKRQKEDEEGAYSIKGPFEQEKDVHWEKADRTTYFVELPDASLAPPEPVATRAVSPQSLYAPTRVGGPLDSLIGVLDHEIKRQSPTMPVSPTPRNTVIFGTALGSPTTDSDGFSPMPQELSPVLPLRRPRASTMLPYHLPEFDEMGAQHGLTAHKPTDRSAFSMLSFYNTSPVLDNRNRRDQLL